MKCTKIKLTRRDEITNKKHKEDETISWTTTGYHGYSYKLPVKCREHLTPRKETEPQLTITTMLFPENIYFNTGSSTERWSKKAPRLISAKRRNYTPRKNMLDDEYDLPYDISEFLDNTDNNKPENVNLDLNFDDADYVAEDIEQLIIKSQIINEESDKMPSKTRKRDKDTAKKKRNKFKKTIKFSFSKPASPETEQVIRIDVTSNISFDDVDHLKNNNNFLLLKNDCSKGHGKLIINEQKKCDNNNNNNINNNERIEKEINNDDDGVEEDFIVKCRQLALTQKKR
ncbi:unnamed protein product [Ceutorhynchus assimilis]|uniref:Uncharacterized protein n=1 Tax=Ceutorhynchus assimilis TaxID=467358 RepID=A0A9N9QJW5_9CUCU|nr:unnamed protein product [Ceutorhynchus assimilis]